MLFERSERNLRKQDAKRLQEQTILARVTAVKERHPEAEDRYEQGNVSQSQVVNDYTNRQFEIDAVTRAATDTAGERFRDVPVVTPSSNEIHVPEAGRDLAVLTFLDGDQRRLPVAIGFHYHRDHHPPIARRGSYRLQKGDLVLEGYEDRDRTEQDTYAEYMSIQVKDKDSQDDPEAILGIEETGPNTDEYQAVITGTDDDDPEISVSFSDGSIELDDGSGASITMDGDGRIDIDGDVYINGAEQ